MDDNIEKTNLQKSVDDLENQLLKQCKFNNDVLAWLEWPGTIFVVAIMFILVLL